MIGVSWLSLSFGRNLGRSEGGRLLGTERFGNPEINCNTMCIPTLPQVRHPATINLQDSPLLGVGRGPRVCPWRKKGIWRGGYLIS